MKLGDKTPLARSSRGIHNPDLPQLSATSTGGIGAAAAASGAGGSGLGDALGLGAP